MSTAQALTLVALVCLAASVFLGRHHLRQRRGLRFIFAGLFLAGVAGGLTSLVSSAILIRLLAVVMLAGIALVAAGIHLEKKRPTPAG
jgi:hypothetical protein